MTRLSMLLAGCLAASVAMTPASFGQGAATAQRDKAAQTKAVTIDESGGRPLRGVVDTLKQKYHVSITYEDPQYVYPGDIVDMTYRRGTPGPRVLLPNAGSLHLSYPEADGVPQEGIGGLLRRAASEYAAAGGPVFKVEKRVTPSGPQWNVVAVKARDRSGTMADQPDILGAQISIPRQKLTPGQFLGAIERQLTAETGYKVTAFDHVFGPMSQPQEFGADNVPARDVLEGLLDGLQPPGTWNLDYDPESGGYYLTLARLAPLPPPRPPVPPPGPAHYGPVPPIVWLHRATIAGGFAEIQAALARAGYYRGRASGKRDAGTADAMRRFQAANGLPATGSLDPQTMLKLEPFLPKLVPEPRPYVPMSPELASWMASTQEGQKEIQEGLVKAGFYKGPVNGVRTAEAWDALKAFQEANGLRADGVFDFQTAVKLAPYLPSPQ
jgi:hypothetical protein